MPINTRLPGLLSRLGVAALLLASAGCGRHGADSQAPGQAAGPLKVRVQLDWYPAPEHGGLFQAQAKGYYRDAGIDVDILPGGPGSYPLQMVGTGRVEFAMGRCDDVIQAVDHGLPLLIVCAQLEHDPQAVMVHEESPVRTFRDLEGRSVMAGPAANWITYVQQHYGVHFNVIPTDYGLARFVGDKDFIQQCFITNEPYFAQLHGIKTRAILIAGGSYDPYRVFFTNRSFAARHPEAVRAFVAATIRGYGEYLGGDSAPGRARVLAENPSQVPALIDYSIETMKSYQLAAGDPSKGERLGLITPERMKAMVQTLVELKVLDAPMALDRFVSFDFLPPPAAPAR